MCDALRGATGRPEYLNSQHYSKYSAFTKSQRDEISVITTGASSPFRPGNTECGLLSKCVNKKCVITSGQSTDTKKSIQLSALCLEKSEKSALAFKVSEDSKTDSIVFLV